MASLGRAATILTVLLLAGACSAGPAGSQPSAGAPSPLVDASPSIAATAKPTPTPTPTPTASPAPSAASVPTTFTSTTYGYSLTVPAGWTTVQATSAWDGTSSISHDGS